MAITARTLAAAITATATDFALDALTGVTAPNFTTGVGVTVLLVDQEMILVTATSGTTLVSGTRGYMGTRAMAHTITSPVLAGLPTDFPAFVAASSSVVPMLPLNYGGVAGPVASAATIVASGSVFHVTGTTATNIITPPTNFVEGQITVIADGVWTFTSSAVTNGIFQSGTVTAAGTAITFVYDAASARWYPSRLA